MLILQEDLGADVLKMSTEEIISRIRLLDNEVKVVHFLKQQFSCSRVGL